MNITPKMKVVRHRVSPDWQTTPRSDERWTSVGNWSRFSIEVPKGTQVLSVQAVFGEVYLWTLEGSPATPTVIRRFRCAIDSRDDSIESAAIFIGTVILHGGLTVFHVFEESP